MKCLSCGEFTLEAVCEHCGAKADQPRDFRAKAVDVPGALTTFFASLKSIPRQLPNAPALAAAEWMRLQEPPREPAARYLQRLLATARAFVLSDDTLRDLVIDARVDRIYWRGEDYMLFLGVIGQAATMREVGNHAYMAQAMGQIKAALRKMGAA